MTGTSPTRRPAAAILALFAMLSACGGGGGGGGSGGAPMAATPTTPAPTPPVTAGGCSLRARQDWAAAQLREWYLFPDLLANGLDPAGYTSVDDYVDALVAPARAQRRDRYFTYLTSIRGEDAYYDAGASGGFGVRLALDAGGRLFVTESFEGAPALAAGIDRGAEIVALGTTAGTLRTVAAILNAEGDAGLNNALGPETAGTSRVLRIRDAAGTRDVAVAKADYTLLPVSTRYGAKVIDDGGRRVGYLNLRTFISTADPALRTAFADFRAQGITQFVVDLRYNGGGLVSTAELVGDLLGGNRATSEVLSYTSFRPEKSAENETRFFAPQSQSVSPTRIAFIGTGGTASASELVINAFVPYLRSGAGLIGTNTYGKPVGQIALDQDGCDDRLRVVAFATQNAERRGDYYDGLARTVEASCQAGDDLSRPLGDPQEASTRQALDFLAGRSCSTIAQGGLERTAAAPGGDQTRLSAASRRLLVPDRATTPQREVPGLF